MGFNILTEWFSGFVVLLSKDYTDYPCQKSWDTVLTNGLCLHPPHPQYNVEFYPSNLRQYFNIAMGG